MRLRGDKEVNIVAELNANMGYRRVLKGKEIRQKREQKMTAQKLNQYMQDTIYYGVLTQKGSEIDLADLYEFESMVTKEEWERVQRMKRNHGKEKTKYDFPFRNIVFCKHCRRPRQIGASRGRGEKQRRKIYYRCDTQGCRDYGKSVRAKEVTTAIADLLNSIRSENIDRAELEKSLKAHLAETQKDVKAQIKDLKTKRTKHENDKKNMATRRVNAEYGKEELAAYNAEQERLRAAIKDYDQKISTLEATLVFSNVDVEDFLNTLKMASEDYEEAPHTVKNEIAQMFILNLFVGDGEVASVKLKAPFDEVIKHPLVVDGGPGGI